MRFQFDARKTQEVQRKHGVSLEEAREIFDQVLKHRKFSNRLQELSLARAEKKIPWEAAKHAFCISGMCDDD